MGALCRSGPLDALGEQEKAVSWYTHSGERHFTVSLCLPDGGNEGLGSFSRNAEGVMFWHVSVGTSLKFLWIYFSVHDCLLISVVEDLWIQSTNVLIRPVLKHGPRSLTCMRVVGWKT